MRRKPALNLPIRPPAKSWAKSTPHWVCLNDEAPRIGSGWRSVVAKVVRKWVYLASRDDRQKITRSVWNQITSHLGE